MRVMFTITRDTRISTKLFTPIFFLRQLKITAMGSKIIARRMMEILGLCCKATSQPFLPVVSILC
jgi:hypothetical protein